MNDSIALNELTQKLDLLIHNPTLMQRSILDLFTEIRKGQYPAVDATSPFMQLIEASVTSASAAVDHQIVNLSKRYPVLSYDTGDLYDHMSDEDYRNRFAVPSMGEFTFLMPFDSLLVNTIASDNGIYKYVSIPADTQVEVDNIVFSFTHAIEIRVHRNNVVKVVYILNGDVSTVANNVIESNVLNDANGVRILTFNIRLKQIRKTVTTRPVVTTATFREEFDFIEGFNSIEVLYKEENQWVSMDISHSSQSFDVSVLKAIIKVRDSKVFVYIPPIYTRDARIGGELKIVISTSAGAIDIDYAEIKRDNFVTNIDDVNHDLTAGDIAFTQCSYMIYSTDHIYGGRDPLSFDELKKRVLDNNVGVNILPITPSVLLSNAEDYGYDGVLHVDSLTHRDYLMSAEIPHDDRLNIKTEPDVGFIKLMESIDSLAEYDTVKANGDSVTILPTTLYEIDQLNVNIVTREASELLATLDPVQRVNTFNGGNYRYSPFFYVYTQDKAILHGEIYQLDSPTVVHKTYLDQNRSVDYYLVSDGVSIDYHEAYYEIRVLLKQDGKLSTVGINELYGQLSFVAVDEQVRTYIDHYSVVPFEEDFIITFRIEHNHHIHGDDNLTITNTTTTGIPPSTNLLTDLYITYGTTVFPVGYEQTDMDGFTHSVDYARRYPLTLESIRVKFGTNLTWLWRDIRPVGTKVTYALALKDTPMVYLEDVYNGDPEFIVEANCEIVADILHKKGDVVLNSEGVAIWKYRKGDILRDDTGEPIILNYTASSYYLDIFIYDGVYYSVNDVNLLKHMKLVTDYLVKKSTVDIKPLQDLKLEHTNLYFKPRDSLGYAKVHTSKFVTTWINKRTLLNIVIYVEESVYNNIQARQIIEHTTFEVVNSNLRKQVISHDVITKELKAAYQLGVISVTLEPTVDAGKLPTLALNSEMDRISLRKEMYITPAGEVSTREDIAITFVNYTIK